MPGIGRHSGTADWEYTYPYDQHNTTLGSCATNDGLLYTERVEDVWSRSTMARVIEACGRNELCLKHPVCGGTSISCYMRNADGRGVYSGKVLWWLSRGTSRAKDIRSQSAWTGDMY